MNFIKGYKGVKYEEMQVALNKAFEISGKSLVQLAAEADVNTTTTMYAALNTEKQTVSDKVLTSVFNSLNFQAFVLWMNGEKYYFIKSKN